MNGKKEYKIFQKERFQTLKCRAAVLYKLTNNNSISTGLILFNPLYMMLYLKEIGRGERYY